MSVYRSGGFPYIGIEFSAGTNDTIPPAGWDRIDEVYEFTEFNREWDVVDFTSHDASLPQHAYTRTAKPGLAVQSTLAFKGIWLEDSHLFFDALYLLRASWPFRLVYSFTHLTTPLTYYFVAWCSAFTLAGDIGDKFVYNITLVCDGEPQEDWPAPPPSIGRSLTLEQLMKKAESGL
jgi:hypothetical protein